MRSAKKEWSCVALMLTMTLILTSALNGRAQDASSSDTSSPGNSSPESTNLGDSSQSSGTPYPSQLQVQPAGRLGSPLTTAAGKVLVGDIVLDSVELDEIWNEASIVNTLPTAVPSSAPVLSTGLRAEVAYDRQFRRTHVVVQYSPNIYIVDGHLIKDISNENTHLGFQVQLTPRLFLVVAETFVYNGAQNLAVDQFFTADFVTQTVEQNTFLNVAGSYLYDQASTALSYFLTARTKVTVTPAYTYSSVSVVPDLSTATATDNSFVTLAENDVVGTVSLDRQLTNTATIGGFYSFDRSYFNSTFGTTYIHTAGLRYSQVIRPTLTFAGTIGVAGAYSNARIGTDEPPAATIVGNLSLIKTYPHAQLSGAYSRGFGSASGFISASYTDRVDAAYARRMTRNWTAGASGAYLRGKTITEFTGSYISLNTGYSLTRTISWFANYGFDQEFGVQTPFYPGAHQFVLTGVRWNASGIHIGNEPQP